MSHVIQILRDWGPAGLFFISILDSAGIPVVGGVDLLIVWIAVNHPASAYRAATMATAGSLIGSLVLFFIARKGGEAYLSKYTHTPRGARLQHWFLEYGLLTILIPAMLPIPMPLKLFELCAGALGVGLISFLAVILVARCFRYYGLAYLGLYLGSNTMAVLKHNLPWLLLIAIALFGALYLLIRRFDRRHKLEKIASE